MDTLREIVEAFASGHVQPADVLAALGALVSAATAFVTAIQRLVLPVLDRIAEATSTDEDDRLVGKLSRGVDAVAGALKGTQRQVARVSLVKAK